MKSLLVFAGEASVGLEKDPERGAELDVKLGVDVRKLREKKKLEVEKEIVLAESVELR